MRTPGHPLPLEQQRVNAIHMHNQGIAAAVIAVSLRVHPQSVRHWLRHYKAGGFEALQAKLHPGPRPRLSDEQKQELLTLLAQPPSAYGMADIERLQEAALAAVNEVALEKHLLQSCIRHAGLVDALYLPGDL